MMGSAGTLVASVGGAGVVGTERDGVGFRFFVAVG